MRLADTVFRGGHLSDGALIEAVMTGERPAHLDRCEICAERAVEIGRWIDQVRTAGSEVADQAFPPERLAAQQAQIMRRLEQLDQPSRVISFPNQTRLARESGGRRVAAGWLGVAAAAGLVIGVVGGQLSARVNGVEPANGVTASQQQPAAPMTTPAPQPTVTPAPRPAAPTTAGTNARLDDSDVDLTRVNLPLLGAYEQATPRLVSASSVK